MADDEFDWIDATSDWLDDDEAFLGLDSFSDGWLSSYDDIDDVWEELPAEVRQPTESFQKMVRVKKVPDSAFRSVETMYDFGARLGDEAVASFSEVWYSDAYANLTSAERARILRKRFGYSVAGAWDLSAMVSREVMTGVLVDRGIVARAPEVLVLPSLERFKGIVAKAVGFDVEKGDYRLGWDTLDGGAKNVIDLAARQALLQTSEVVNELTGDPLFGRRLVQNVNACSYCRQAAMEGFDVDVSRNARFFLGFHDNCRCTIELV